jgi:two-component system response regulator EvgA
MKILLADDSVLVLERLQEILGEIDQVEVVASLDNGIDTLKALRNLNPDVAIIDIQMPGLTGLEVLNTYRKENKSVIFIVMTFHSQGYYKQLAIQAGTNYFFNKVDDFEEITKVVETLCKREEFSFR